MLIIDSNQNAMTPEIRVYLAKRMPVIISPLDTGDMMFMGEIQGEQFKIGIEIKKTPSDLMGSLRDGRLMTQLPRLTQEFDIGYLLLVGEEINIDFDKGKVKERVRGGRWGASPFSFNYLNSILTRFEASGGRIRSVRDMPHMTTFIVSLMNWWRKGTHTEEVFVRKRHKFLEWQLMDRPLVEIYERMGVGINRALVLAEKYPSFKSLCQANQKELQELNGFGKVTAQKILEFIDGK